MISKGVEDIKQLPGKIKDALIDLAGRFLDFVGILIEKMFSFLAQVGNTVNKFGYNLSKIEVKLPKLQIKQVSILSVISIPLPVIDPPDITLTISGKTVDNSTGSTDKD